MADAKRQDAPHARFKVAIIGKAPSSRMIAPYDQPEAWEIWSISDNYNVIPRWDRWFEIHDLTRYKELYPEYFDWMCSLPAGERPLYITDTEYKQHMPAAVEFPWRQIVKHWGGYFTNSISWLICFAADEITRAIKRETGKASLGPEDYRAFGAAIGTWGVDMATATEYEHQRPSCEWFLGWARGMGIDVVIPDECDLLKTARLYAVEAFRGEFDRKVRVRDHELGQRIAKFEGEFKHAQGASYAATGAAQEVRRLAEVLNVHPQLAARLLDRAKELEQEAAQASGAAGHLRQSLDMCRGAREDLKWCRQFA